MSRMRERMSNYLQGGYTCKIAKLRWNRTSQLVVFKKPKKIMTNNNVSMRDEQCV
jgi:hypothetical protein